MEKPASVSTANLISRPRIESIDLLRGMVMILMALDHVRDFVHFDTIRGLNPLDLDKTTPALYFTRWITHYCAPVFIFLSGASIYFVGRRTTPGQLSIFLFTRGIWLILMEMTLIHIGWSADFNYVFLMFAVIWIIGWSMVLLAFLTRLPMKYLLLTGLILIFGHNLLDAHNEQLVSGPFGMIYSFLHYPAYFELAKGHGIFFGYPLIPWVGVMACGVALGSLYRNTTHALQRKKTLILLGTGSIALFILLRFWNIYGEMQAWSVQKTPMLSLMSFLDTTKYPPSLLYLLMTLGPAFLFLAFAENIRNRLTAKIIVFGRVPFFYYLMHLYLIHAIALVLFFSMGFKTSDFIHGETIGGFPPGFGISLTGTYLVWILVIFLLYYPCKWYNLYKSCNSKWWLSYL